MNNIKFNFLIILGLIFEIYNTPLYSQIFEAEDADFDGVIQTEHTGYSGTGYVNYPNEIGSYIEWTISLPEAKQHQLIMRYANGSSADRILDINVNNTSEPDRLMFPSTSDWDNWSLKSMIVSLNQGMNTIRAVSVNSDGGPNIDYILIAGVEEDNEVPSTPSGLKAQPISSTQVSLTWDSSTDNVGVSGYLVYRNDSEIGNTPVNSFLDNDLTPESEHYYHIMAYDYSGNYSAESETVTVTTFEQGNTEVLAFPGAKGFAGKITGGRGGQVLKVSTLDNAGPGSLQWAVDQDGPKIIIFEVSGIIEGDINISQSDVTIAGQTAPGAGITIHGHLTTTYGNNNISNIIIRHLRIRPPGADSDWPPQQHDAIQFGGKVQGVMLDHIDVSHAIDEDIDMWGGPYDVTIQNSIISFPVPDGNHPDGAHNYGMINHDGRGTGAGDVGRISIINNLFAHCKKRTPALSMGPAEVINNVIYDAREGFVHHNPAFGKFRLIGNYYKDGPSNSLIPFWFDPENNNPPTEYYLEDNYINDPGKLDKSVDNPITDVDYSANYSSIHASNLRDNQFNQSGRFDFTSYEQYVPYSILESTDAYEEVINYSGAFPRDFISNLAIEETKESNGLERTVSINASNLMDGLLATLPESDTDDDGVPDEWEDANNLSSDNPDDYNTIMPSGYTAIEEYINQLSDFLVYGIPPTGILSDENNHIYRANGFHLKQNYPNPFNATTYIPFSISRPMHISIKVYNTNGEMVSTLVDEQKNPGSYYVKFNAANIPSGLYFYAIFTDTGVQTKKLILIK